MISKESLIGNNNTVNINIIIKQMALFSHVYYLGYLGGSSVQMIPKYPVTAHSGSVIAMPLFSFQYTKKSLFSLSTQVKIGWAPVLAIWITVNMMPPPHSIYFSHSGIWEHWDIIFSIQQGFSLELTILILCPFMQNWWRFLLQGGTFFIGVPITSVMLLPFCPISSPRLYLLIMEIYYTNHIFWVGSVKYWHQEEFGLGFPRDPVEHQERVYLEDDILGLELREHPWISDCQYPQEFLHFREKMPSVFKRNLPSP